VTVAHQTTTVIQADGGSTKKTFLFGFGAGLGCVDSRSKQENWSTNIGQ
jgi:hypothetical protein